MSIIYIPFDNNPISVTNRSGSYTIPANTFARVDVLNPDLQYNGEYLFLSSSGFVRNNDDTPGGEFFMTPPGALVNLSIGYYSGTFPGSYASFQGAGGSLKIFDHSSGGSNASAKCLAPSDCSRVYVYAAGNGELPPGVYVGIEVQVFTPPKGEIWIPSGVVLNGTSYVVTEYPAVN